MTERIYSRRDFIRLAGLAPILPLEGRVKWLSEYLDSLAPRPIIWSGFRPYNHGEDWNSSTMIVNFFQAQYQKQRHPKSEMYFLPNLPVNYADPGSTARQIEDLARIRCPKGGIILSLGEDPNLSKYNAAARIEYQSQFSPDVPAGFPIDNLPIWQTSDTLRRQITKSIEENRQNIFGPNSNLGIQLPIGLDTAGGNICEKTLTALNDFSYREARASKPRPFLPIFIHVPDSNDIQALQPTIKIVSIVIKEATSYFQKYRRHPKEFVTRFIPEERGLSITN